jgi:hypothetical protein
VRELLTGIPKNPSSNRSESQKMDNAGKRMAHALSAKC